MLGVSEQLDLAAMRAQDLAEIARPRPLPSAFDEPANGSNSRLRTCSGMPGPVSATSIARNVDVSSAEIRNLPPRSPIASIAFCAKLNRTRNSWSGSAWITMSAATASRHATPALAVSSAARTFAASSASKTARGCGAGGPVRA